MCNLNFLHILNVNISVVKGPLTELLYGTPGMSESNVVERLVLVMHYACLLYL